MRLVDRPNQFDPWGGEWPIESDAKQPVDDQSRTALQQGRDFLSSRLGIDNPEHVHAASSKQFGFSGKAGVIAIVAFARQDQHEITGLVDKPLTIDAQELIEMFPLEERVYRLRCVEAWAIIVPWTGFPLSKLIEKAAPRPEAKFIRCETFSRPEQAGMRRLREYPWPYSEGLRMDEAMNLLTMLVCGVYGKPLPKQHGAPVRLIVPWKYGYKSIKSIVKIEFVAEQPKTFWETLAADEYPFESNVNPKVPHPRWSQAVERMIDTGDRVKTQLYNGYGNYVAKLYGKA